MKAWYLVGGLGVAVGCSGEVTKHVVYRAADAGAPVQQPDAASSCGDTLWSDDNCGACGRTCNGGLCANGYCEVQTLAKDIRYPSHLALRNGQLFWVDVDADDRRSLHRMPAAGGRAETVFTFAANTLVLDAVFDDTAVFLSIETFAEPLSKTSLQRLDLATSQLVPLAATSSEPFAMSLDDTHVYWATAGSYREPAPGLQRTPKAGGNTEVLMATPTNHLHRTLLAPPWLYFSRASEDEPLGRIPLQGGAPEVLSTSGPKAAARSLVMSGDTLLAGWGESDDFSGALRRVAPGGGTKTLWDRGPVDAMASAGGFVYWASGLGKGDLGREGNLFRMPAAGGAPLVLAPTDAYPMEVLVDDQWVYFASMGRERVGTIPGSIKRVPR